MISGPASDTAPSRYHSNGNGCSATLILHRRIAPQSAGCKLRMSSLLLIEEPEVWSTAYDNPRAGKLVISYFGERLNTHHLQEDTQSKYHNS
jgi:hypothetical protein